MKRAETRYKRTQVLLQRPPATPITTTTKIGVVHDCRMGFFIILWGIKHTVTKEVCLCVMVGRFVFRWKQFLGSPVFGSLPPYIRGWFGSHNPGSRDPDPGSHFGILIRIPNAGRSYARANDSHAGGPLRTEGRTLQTVVLLNSLQYCTDTLNHHVSSHETTISGSNSRANCLFIEPFFRINDSICIIPRKMPWMVCLNLILPYMVTVTLVMNTQLGCPNKKGMS